jgi:hypothetical protein
MDLSRPPGFTEEKTQRLRPNAPANVVTPSSLPLRTSRNQILRLLSHRYTPADFSEELTEVSIKEGGRVEVTGFPTLGLPW